VQVEEEIAQVVNEEGRQADGWMDGVSCSANADDLGRKCSTAAAATLVHV